MQEQFYAFQSTPDAGVFAEFVRSHVSNPRLLSQLMQFVDAWNAAPASSQFAGQAEYYMQGIIQAYANAPTIGASGLSSVYCWHSVCYSRIRSYT